MNDPYEVLGLTPAAGESEIRERYLELVRAFPPERAPERFAAIHEAYASLRDPANHLRERIFRVETKNDSFDAIAADLRKRLRVTRLPLQVLLELADAP